MRKRRGSGRCRRDGWRLHHEQLSTSRCCRLIYIETGSLAERRREHGKNQVSNEYKLDDLVGLDHDSRGFEIGAVVHQANDYKHGGARLLEVKIFSSFRPLPSASARSVLLGRDMAVCCRSRHNS